MYITPETKWPWVRSALMYFKICIVFAWTLPSRPKYYLPLYTFIKTVLHLKLGLNRDKKENEDSIWRKSLISVKKEIKFDDIADKTRFDVGNRYKNICY